MRECLLVWLLGSALGVGVAAACDCHGCKRHDAVAEATSTVAKVKDPVCGMDVDPAKALKADHKGKTYYFCSKHCQEKFQKDPAQYEAKKSE